MSLTYKMDKKYGENYNLLFSNGIKWSVSVSCDIKISAMVTTCSVKNTRISSSLKTICINKPPLQTDGLDGINNPIYSINATEQTSLYSLTDRAKCFTTTCENIAPSVILRDENVNNTRDRDIMDHLYIYPLYCLYQQLQNISYCNDSKIIEFEIIDTKNTFSFSNSIVNSIE